MKRCKCKEANLEIYQYVLAEGRSWELQDVIRYIETREMSKGNKLALAIVRELTRGKHRRGAP